MFYSKRIRARAHLVTAHILLYNKHINKFYLKLPVKKIGYPAGKLRSLRHRRIYSVQYAVYLHSAGK